MRQLSIILCLSLLLSACASHYGAARIVSTPPGAEVVSGEDGSSLGVTPTTVVWKDSSSNRQHLILRFQKEGYYEKVSSFWLSMRHATMEQAEEDSDLVEVVLQKKEG
ncbi:MAG: hypothetical protein HKN85_07850 [Gammaproteobacteria bacterium]|nr:hypothetical protein [Gammaproteobacteria bacterium]